MKAHALAVAMVFAAVPLCDFVAPDTLDAGQSRQTERREARLRAMDRNNDGMITRAEWRGNDRSFQVHDWDRDGILSADEIRQAADRTGQDAEGVDDDQPGGEVQEWTAAAFRDLDHDNDRRITRDEWHYDRESFTRADRDGDGSLSRREFLDGDTSAAPDLFARLDANGDDRITETEWRGTERAFNERDRNADGMLSRYEMSGSEPGSVGTSGRVFSVDANRRWTDTGIDVRPGDVIGVQAEGNVTLSSNAQDVASPGGSATGRRAQGAPLPDQPAGALIARIGYGAPLVVGRDGSFTAHIAGRLYLGVNDDYLLDNEGQFRVTLTPGR
jgi:Ca2+-binding EF-hand superfamily protein